MRISKLFFVTAISILGTGIFSPIWAGDLADKAVGTWLRSSEGWHVEFSMCGDQLCGEVVSGEGNDKKTGKSVVGVKMLYDLERASANSWKGKMYNPGDGNVYKGIVKMLGEDELKMSGCMMGFLCRSEVWSRVEEMPAPMPEESMEEDATEEETMEESADEDMAEEMADEVEAAVEEITSTDE